MNTTLVNPDRWTIREPEVVFSPGVPLSQIIESRKPPVISWRAREVFKAVLTALLEDATPKNQESQSVVWTLGPKLNSRIGTAKTQEMLFFLRTYRVIHIKPVGPGQLHIRFQNAVLTDFVECEPKELEPLLQGHRRRRELLTLAKKNGTVKP